MQNRKMIAQHGIDFELLDDDGVDDKYRLKPSAIHGLGVYLANSDLLAGATLMEYRGDIITKAESDIREAQYAANGLDIYLFSINENNDTVIDGTKRGNIARFINHSCSPNCECVGDDENDSIQIVSLVPIKNGSEITINYRLQPGERIECNCGASNCQTHL